MIWLCLHFIPTGQLYASSNVKTCILTCSSTSNCWAFLLSSSTTLSISSLDLSRSFCTASASLSSVFFLSSINSFSNWAYSAKHTYSQLRLSQSPGDLWNTLRYPVLALTIKIRKSQDFLAPISRSPGDQIFSLTFRNSTSIFLNSFME